MYDCGVCRSRRSLTVYLMPSDCADNTGMCVCNRIVAMVYLMLFVIQFNDKQQKGYAKQQSQSFKHQGAYGIWVLRLQGRESTCRLLQCGIRHVKRVCVQGARLDFCSLGESFFVVCAFWWRCRPSPETQTRYAHNSGRVFARGPGAPR